jgi:hypothetical protein
MLKPICVKCKLFFKPKKSGITVEEGKPVGRDPEVWMPYKLWVADLWECRGCGDQIVYGSGQRPLAEDYQKDYPEVVERHPPLLRVNDC